jgi:RimJ/RimL family protein N-acetyltransferase
MLTDEEIRQMKEKAENRKDWYVYEIDENGNKKYIGFFSMREIDEFRKKYPNKKLEFIRLSSRSEWW